MRKIILSIGYFVVVLATALSVAGQTPSRTIEVTLEVGASKVFDDSALGSTSKGTSKNPKVATVIERTISGLKKGDAIIEFSDTEPLLQAHVTVTEINPVVTLKRNGVAVALADEIPAFSSDVYTLELQGHNDDGKLRPITARSVIASQPAVVKVDASNERLTIEQLQNTGRIDPPATVVSLTITLPDDTTRILKLRVIETPKNVRVDLPATIKEDTGPSVPITVTGSGGGIYHSATSQFGTMYRFSCDPEPLANASQLVSVTSADGQQLSISRINGNERPKFKVKCTAFGLGRDMSALGSSEITILPSGGTIRLTPATLTLFGGQQAGVTAQVFDRANTPMREARVGWSIVGGGDPVVLSPQNETSLTVTASTDDTKIPSSGIVNILASAPGTDGTPITATLPLKIVSGAGFTRVRGGLEILDYQTAKDLYGAQTAEDFYIAKITLLNDLKDDLAGASILVFSDSLGISVNMQKTHFPKNKMRSAEVKKATWAPLQFEDLRKLGLPITYPLAIDDLPRKNAPGHPANDIDKQVLYTCDDIWYAEQPLQLTPEEEADEKLRARRLRERDDRIAAARLRQLRYRPYSYDMVIKSFDPRDNRTGRSLTFRALTFAGSVASFVTGVPNFGASMQFVAVNEKFGSTLVPALATLWPSLRETQRQNLVDDTMHPIEEIPYSSSVTRKIFLPKYPLQVAADTWFRISEVCLFDFQVEVAISHKKQQTVANTLPPVGR